MCIPERLRGYQEALVESGLKFSDKMVFVNDLSEEASCNSAKKIAAMRPMPDGIFITNDFCAAVCMQTLKEAGIRIPEDIAVVGFNNDVISKIVEPKLTTINYPGVEIGEDTGQEPDQSPAGKFKHQSYQYNYH